MKSLILSMDVKPTVFRLGLRLMRKAIMYCDRITIDGREIDLNRVEEENSAPKYNSASWCFERDTIFHIEYYLKEGVDYIPEIAFTHAEIMGITIPEGIKTLKKGCFKGCIFECDLILPESLEKIEVDVFNMAVARRAKVRGEFRLPSGIKIVCSLPDSQWYKEEIILPEGMIKYCPEHIGTNHLYIPASMKECRSGYAGPELVDGQIVKFVVKKVTISPDNKYLTVRNKRLMRVCDLNKDSYRYTPVLE